jgi:hypothetical protein
VMHDDVTGVNFGASDPRADGAAIPEQPPVQRTKQQGVGQ